MPTGDHLRSVRPGDSFPRDQATINAWQRAARDRQGSERKQSCPPLQFAPDRPGVVRVKNNTGQHLDRFSVLGVSAPIYQPSEAPNEYFQRDWFTGMYPDVAAHVGSIVVLQEPLRDGAIGSAVYRGLTWVQVNAGSTTPQYAAIEDGVCAYLKPVSFSANPIQWIEAGTGLKWAFVDLGQFPDTITRRIELKAGETLTPGGSATAYLLEWGGTSYSPDTSVEITVQDAFSRFRQSSPPSGQDGARGYATHYGDRDVWELIDLEHQAKWIEFVADGAYAPTDASATVDGVTYHEGYEPTTAITTVYNKGASANYIFEGGDNDRGMAKYSIEEDKYYIWQAELLECP